MLTMLVVLLLNCLDINAKTVTITTAGTLKDYISDAEKYSIEELTISGPLNGTDFHLIREMAGCGDDVIGGDAQYFIVSTGGILKYLDIRDARIVTGGTPFYIEGDEYEEDENWHSWWISLKEYKISTSNEISEMLFAKTDLEEIILPNTVKAIDSYAFSFCDKLKKVVLPSSLTNIYHHAFSDCGLTEITIPTSVTGFGAYVFDNTELKRIYWYAKHELPDEVNANVLVYTDASTAKYIPAGRNLIINGVGEYINLAGVDIRLLENIQVKNLEYVMEFTKTTGVNSCLGWETIALPFNVQSIRHKEKDVNLLPFSVWNENEKAKPFWLYRYSEDGFITSSGIEAWTPYIIAMPHNDIYNPEYDMAGTVVFYASDVTIPFITPDIFITSTYSGKTFYPYYGGICSSNRYLLNWKGSSFELSSGEPSAYTAYMTTNANYSRSSIPIFDERNIITGIQYLIPDNESIMSAKEDYVPVFNIVGHQIGKTRLEDVNNFLQSKPSGMYLIKGKKYIKL